MAWLGRDGKVLATLEVANAWRARSRGLLGRDGFEGALLLRPARSVHTIRMRFPIDVAFLDRSLEVVKVLHLPPNRVTLPVLRSKAVLEAEAGAFAAWELRPGDQLEVRGDDVEAGG